MPSPSLTPGMSTDEEETVEPPTARDDVVAIIGGGLIGAAGGFVGTALMTVALMIGQAIGVFDLGAFASIAELIELDEVFPPATLSAIGYFIFLAGGMTAWPLLFASVERYLPGSTLPRRGMSFGTVLWTGFVLAFSDALPPLATQRTVALYAGITLVAHWLYGFGLGLVFEYFATRDLLL